MRRKSTKLKLFIYFEIVIVILLSSQIAYNILAADTPKVSTSSSFSLEILDIVPQEGLSLDSPSPDLNVSFIGR